MIKWNPKEELNILNYIKFKLRFWVQVSSIPNWVKNASKKYFQNFQDKYGHRPYDQVKIFYGNNLKYKIIYEMSGHSRIEEKKYIKIK